MSSQSPYLSTDVMREGEDTAVRITERGVTSQQYGLLLGAGEGRARNLS